MKRYNLLTLVALSATTQFLSGGTTEPQVDLGNEPDAFRSLTPTFNLRSRYEFREIDRQDASHAFTTRARLGLLTGDFGGFSAFGELEATYALIDDYRSNPTSSTSTDPYVAGNTPIGDPENFELNRAWVQYKGHNTTLKIGRQRIKRNNDAFIGNVGWRQNEQTYDAISLAYSGDNFDLFYAYSNQVNRIFGHDANDTLPGPPLKEFEGDFHFIDGSYRADFGTVGGYAFLIDVDNNTAVGRSNTFGTHLTTDSFYAEIAWQDGSSSLVGDGDYDAFYGHAKVFKKAQNATYSAGFEYLQENFKTPFATVHAFNGFADAFVLQRIGLKNVGGSYNGLSNLYFGYQRSDLPCDITFKGFLHWFLDDHCEDTYGYEADAVLVKKVSKDLTVLLKAAYFLSENDPAYPDIKQLSLQCDYQF